MASKHAGGFSFSTSSDRVFTEAFAGGYRAGYEAGVRAAAEVVKKRGEVLDDPDPNVQAGTILELEYVEELVLSLLDRAESEENK